GRTSGERVEEDTKTGMRSGERDRVAALRLIANALQQDAKLGDGDEVSVLQRERKKRLEAAEAYAGGGRDEQAGAERAEGDVVEAYLPGQLRDDELEESAGAAVEECGAEGPKEMGKVMSTVMPKVHGRADGKRVSEAVRARLGS